MVPTHATKAGVRYRYYASAPVLHGEAKTASAGSVSRVPAAEIEEAVLKSLKDHLIEQQNGSAINTSRIDDREAIAQLVSATIVHKDKLVVRLNSDSADEASDNSNDRSISIPWQKPPSKRARQILLPSNKSRSEVRPQHFERRAQLVSAIARGRQWLDDVVSGRMTTVAELCARENCSARKVNTPSRSPSLRPILSKRPSKVACPAASASNASAICRPNGASSSRFSDLVRNSLGAQSDNPPSSHRTGLRLVPGTGFWGPETGPQMPPFCR